MEFVQNCNLCGSAERLALYELKDWLMERDDVATTLVKCQTCGLVYQSPRPTLEEMVEFYPDEYEPYSAGLEILKHNLISRLFLEIGLYSKVRLILSQKEKGKLLDVGCASGLFLYKMSQNLDWVVEGVEINPHASRLAKEEFNIDVFTGTLEEANFPDESFDVVTMWDVLEHLHDPSSSLKEIYRILKPEGILALRLPNFDSLDAKLFSKYWSGLDSPRHTFVFGKKTIKEMLHLHGFRIVKINTNTGEYMGFLLSLRMYFYAKRVNKDHRDFLVKLLTHPIIRIMLYPIFFVWSYLGLGTQMNVIAQREFSRQ